VTGAGGAGQPEGAPASEAIPRPWRTLGRRSLADQRPWLRLWAEDVELPDGRVVEGFLGLEMPDVVMVVALTPDNQVVAIRSYKHGPRRVCLNLPAGYLEPGEEPLAAAQRELREETGHAAEAWTALGSFAGDGNRGAGTTHLYLARDARRVAAPDSGDLEEIAVEEVALDALLRATRDGGVAVLSVAAAIGLAAARLAEG
jgi:ADP-ribose pyrophosphatase